MKKLWNIILISNENWGDLWYSKHHYANELHQLGHQVYFVNPAGRWHPGCLFNAKVNTSVLKDGFYTVNYRNPWPTLHGESVFRQWNDHAFAKKLREKLSISAADWLIWHFDPYRLAEMKALEDLKMILHIVDRYHGKLDVQISSNADLTVSVSKAYTNRYASSAQRLLHIPHGIAAEWRKPDPGLVASIREKYGPYYLYAGSFNSGVDYRLLLTLASKITTHNLLLLGPEPKGLTATQLDIFRNLLSCDRVMWPGVIKGSELNRHIKASELCIIPYLQSQSFRVQTLKAIQYLALQKPVVSLPLIDLEPYEGDSVFFAENHGGFLQNCIEILKGNRKTDFTKSDVYCDGITYPVLIDTILKNLGE